MIVKKIAGIGFVYISLLLHFHHSKKEMESVETVISVRRFYVSKLHV